MNQVTSFQPGDTASSSSRSATLRRRGALITGASLALLGLSQRTKSGLALAASGGLFAYMGLRGDSVPRVLVAQGEVLVNCDAKQAYRFWRNFENVSLFMVNVESVTTTPDGRAIWIALGPLGTRIIWESTVVSERENEFLLWGSVPGSAIFVEGSVEFRPAPANRGTIVSAMMRFRPQPGAVARATGAVLGRYPNFLMRHNLRRFKAFIETGEIPTTEGQTHGPRSTKIATLRLADPTRPLRPETRISEAVEALRRIA
jgi:uncharacterized membrane protein